ncbi:MAG: prepilin-type N-terminal cleavage/methylation domain-containing protein [Pseudomonadota bacterium]
MDTAALSKRRAQRGFNLIELMMVVAMVSILASFAIAGYIGYIDRARSSSAVSDIGRIALEVERWATNNDGNFPVTLADVGLAGLQDPWGQPYEYLSVDAAGGPGPLRKDGNNLPLNTDFDLYSRGPDGATALVLTAGSAQDDIVRANDGGWVGPGEDY